MKPPAHEPSQYGQDAYIALGANLGNAPVTLRRAVADIARLGDVAGVSSLYRTAPLGGPPGQPDYLNAALHLRTSLPAQALLDALHDIEACAGRTRTERWEARMLDLDLLLYGTQVTGSDTLLGLTLPHPRAWERAFVLAPLADLHAELPHPVTGETVRAALERVGAGGVERAASQWAVSR